MDQIRQYQELSLVKPQFHRLHIPYHKPSLQRIEFNLKELELYYDESDDTYKESPKKKIGGGNESPAVHEIILLDDLF